MKYKVRDKIKIKTWEALEKEFGVDDSGDINCNTGDQRLNKARKMRPEFEKRFCKENPDRIVTIIKYYDFAYDPQYEFDVKETDLIIGRMWIEEIVPPVLVSRFEIMDL